MNKWCKYRVASSKVGKKSDGRYVEIKFITAVNNNQAVFSSLQVIFRYGLKIINEAVRTNK